MSGAIWATVAGVKFGMFQSVNRQAVRGLDLWPSTVLQLAVSSVVLLAARWPPGTSPGCAPSHPSPWPPSSAPG
jgi:hypothetical protein